jgi:hypothetical protein
MRDQKASILRKMNNGAKNEEIDSVFEGSVAGTKKRHMAGKKGNNSLHGGRGPCDAASHDLSWRY